MCACACVCVYLSVCVCMYVCMRVYFVVTGLPFLQQNMPFISLIALQSLSECNPEIDHNYASDVHYANTLFRNFLAIIFIFLYKRLRLCMRALKSLIAKHEIITAILREVGEGIVCVGARSSRLTPRGAVGSGL